MNRKSSDLIPLSRRCKKVIAAGIPTAAVIGILLRRQITALSYGFGVCVFHELTGFYCPGCGNTRSVRALLRFDIMASVRNNPAMPFLALVIVALYIEITASLFGKQVKLLPRKQVFWWTALALFMVFYVLRNFFPLIAPIPDAPRF